MPRSVVQVQRDPIANTVKVPPGASNVFQDSGFTARRLPKAKQHNPLTFSQDVSRCILQRIQRAFEDGWRHAESDET